MITFKQFLHEKVGMHKGAFAAARDRMKDDAKIGFEIEVFVPEDSMYWAAPDEGKAPANVENIDRMDTLTEFDAMFNFDKTVVLRDYGNWLAEKQEEYVDENWRDHDDDEKIGRKAAARAFNPKRPEYDFTSYFEHTFKSALQFVQEYDLEPKYGWAEEAVSVYTTEPKSAEYMDGWRDTAMGVASSLKAVVGGRVKINGTGYDSWNITHDSSIKDNDGVDYESGMKGYGLEIVSPPMPIDEAFNKLNQVLVWCDRNEIETNETTGLHVNVSLPDMTNFDPLKLILFMGDKYILAKFNRLTNSFARSQYQNVIDSVQANGKPKDTNELVKAAREGLKASTKWFSVNLGHLPTYLEFRAIGGQGYHKRLEELHDVMGRYLTAVELANDPNKERQAYLKKVANLMNTVPGDGDTLGAEFRAKKAAKT